MASTKVLKIVFAMPNNKKLTWTLADPKNDLTLASIQSVANNIVNKSGIMVNGTEPDGFERAYIYQTTTTEVV